MKHLSVFARCEPSQPARKEAPLTLNRNRSSSNRNVNREIHARATLRTDIPSSENSVFSELELEQGRHAGRPDAATASQRGFTLLEIVIVVVLMALLALSVSSGFGLLTRYRESQFITDLAQTLEFLHAEALSSQQFYQIEFDLVRKSWHVGLLQPDDQQSSTVPATGVGILTMELADFLNPPLGNAQAFMIPPDFPSLAKERIMPGTGGFADIVTPRGKITPETGEKPYIIFSPRGFTEFSVLHMTLQNSTFITLVTNPFTGEIEIHDGYKEFRWSFDTPEGL